MGDGWLGGWGKLRGVSVKKGLMSCEEAEEEEFEGLGLGMKKGILGS